MPVASFGIYHFSTVVDFSSEKYSGSTGHSFENKPGLFLIQGLYFHDQHEKFLISVHKKLFIKYFLFLFLRYSVILYSISAVIKRNRLHHFLCTMPASVASVPSCH